MKRKWIAVSLKHGCQAQKMCSHRCCILFCLRMYPWTIRYTLCQFNVIMQYVMYIVTIMFLILYVYVAEWKHIIRLKLAVTVTGVRDVANVHAIL